MICEDCTRAADLATWMKRRTTTVFRREVIERHAACKGCSCQHRVEVDYRKR